MKRACILTLLFVIASSACNHNHDELPLYYSAPWEPDFSAPRIKEYPGDPPTMLFMGDSRIAIFPIQLYWPSNHLVNLGHGGITTRGLQERAYLVGDYDPDIIIISIGINDVLGGARRGAPVEGMIQRIRMSLEIIKELSPDAAIYITGIIPTRDPGISATAHYYTNDIIDLCLETGTVYVDMAVMEDADGLLRIDLADSDGVHYSPLGYDVFAAALIDAL